MSDRLSREKLNQLLNGELEVVLFDEIDSTNEEAKRRVRRNETQPALIVAEGQT